jgi:hypothetical protein
MISRPKFVCILIFHIVLHISPLIVLVLAVEQEAPIMHFFVSCYHLFLRTRVHISNIRGYNQKFPDWVITKYMLTTINTRWEATQRVMAAKLTRLTHKIVIHLQRELYHLQFSLQAASPETFGYTLVHNVNFMSNKLIYCAGGRI